MPKSSAAKVLINAGFTVRAETRSGEIERTLHAYQKEHGIDLLVMGAYGWCNQCGELIASGRLEFDPATPLCITCASRAESG